MLDEDSKLKLGVFDALDDRVQETEGSQSVFGQGEDYPSARHVDPRRGYGCSSLAEGIESQWSAISSLRSLDISDQKAENDRVQDTIDPSFQDSDMRLVPNEDEVERKEADMMIKQFDNHEIEVARNRLFGHN